MPPLLGFQALRIALGALPPRSAQVLACRILDGRSLKDCAHLYGVSEEAFAIHQLRATRALAERLGWVAEAPAWTDAEEARLAAALDRALDSPSHAPKATLTPLVELAHQLRSQAEPLKAALVAAEEAAARSPQRQREERLRVAAMVVLVLLTLYFLMRQGR